MPLERWLDRTPDPPSDPEALYTRLSFPAPPEDRPYLYINMVSTVDGKIVIGKIGGTSKGVGGPTDQKLFRRLQHTCDAALIGASTLRAGNVIYPPEIPRFVVTASGNVPLSNRFFTDAPDKAAVLAPEDIPLESRARLEAQGIMVVAAGHGTVDLPAALRWMRREKGIRYLLCEGGATLNDALLRAGLADELFLTLAPKLKGGAKIPTTVTGQGFPPGRFLALTLLSLYHDGDELYLRYRIHPGPEQAGS
ncbi:MAG TPA: dihydrofolate reductase family protein [Chthonomonadaceae bacterium]|nr:dihydrofolate reductase family protein [Chthonomonadaceae bacterium]